MWNAEKYCKHGLNVVNFREDRKINRFKKVAELFNHMLHENKKSDLILCSTVAAAGQKKTIRFKQRKERQQKM